MRGVIILALLTVATSTAVAQTYTIDDNPFAPLLGPPGVIPGCGPEDQFGLAAAFCPPGLAPSPSLGIVLPPLGSGSILGPGPVLSVVGSNGFYIDSLSGNRRPPLANIVLRFSVDRLSVGAIKTSVATQAALNQQPSDIFESDRFFTDPAAFVGTLGPGPYAGVLPAALGGKQTNGHIFDDAYFGLLSGGAVVGRSVAVAPIAPLSHDNIDAYNEVPLDTNNDLLPDVYYYFTVNPDEAASVGVAPAEIFDVAPGGVGGPYATPATMGLDSFGASTDSIDALVLFDNGALGGPATGGPGAEPAIDFALFSLAPGSSTLSAFALTAADVFFTDFTGAFALYASSTDLGLVGAPGGQPTIGDNIDALEIRRLGEPTFSVDLQGPMVGMPDSFSGSPITEGDILTAFLPGPPGPNPPSLGPLPPPGLELGAIPGAPGVFPGGLGILPGLTGFVEVDALSYGRDRGLFLHFSVDEFAAGVAFVLGPADVATEGSLGANEASADVFQYLGPVAATPPGPVFRNLATIDGDGLNPSGLPGLGLIEPNPPTPGLLPDPGDNLDALDVDTTLADIAGPVFFSLDSAYIDLLEVAPINSGTAPGNGVSGADVLMSFAGGAPVVAIPGSALGLDLVGFDTDDLDALAFDDADGSLSLTAGDALLFSVRRGSAVIGTPDSLFGLPIEEGDILAPPATAGFPPAIFVSADSIGLATVRAGTAGPFGADDVDAIDVPEPEFLVQLAAGVASLVAMRRRRMRRTDEARRSRAP